MVKFRFTGEIKICLEGATMKVGRGTSCTQSPVYSGPLPGNGIIYDANGASCSTEYSPFNVAYPAGTVSTCGNINIEGTFANAERRSSELTSRLRGGLTSSLSEVENMLSEAGKSSDTAATNMRETLRVAVEEAIGRFATATICP